MQVKEVSVKSSEEIRHAAKRDRRNGTRGTSRLLDQRVPKSTGGKIGPDDRRPKSTVRPRLHKGEGNVTTQEKLKSARQNPKGHVDFREESAGFFGLPPKGPDFGCTKAGKQRTRNGTAVGDGKSSFGTCKKSYRAGPWG